MANNSKKTTANWSERFDEWYTTSWYRNQPKKSMKQFIAQLLKQQKKQVIEEIKNAYMECIQFHDIEMEDATFIKQKDLLKILASLSKEGDK